MGPPSLFPRIDMPALRFLKYFLAPHCSGAARINRICLLLPTLYL